MEKKNFDVVIIGGGVSGTALLYELSHFTNLENICLLEKYHAPATLNSHGRNNSQTLHCGDIETNYSLEKALQVKRTAEMVVNYSLRQKEKDSLIFRHPKMVLGVGDEECEKLRKRYSVFSDHYSSMQIMEQADIAKIEPNVIKKRKEPVLSLGMVDEYSTVDYGLLSESFVSQASQVKGKNIDVKFNAEVRNISQQGDTYYVKTKHGTIESKFVVVTAGAHSLLFAHRMGYGKEYSCLPMAGSFYYTPSSLNGKVYTVQNDNLPFAAIHGDPDVLMPGKTRFGPTALVLPMLERYNWNTIIDFFRVLRPDLNVAKVMYDLLKVKDVRNYIFTNIMFEVPVLRTWLFQKYVQKIIPSMLLSDLSFARKIGGVRPVMIDKKNRVLHLGEAKISPGNGVIFNMTPSPGATSCLGNAENDVRIIADYLQCEFNETEFNAVLHERQN